MAQEADEGGGLFVVDNSDRNWKALRYLLKTVRICGTALYRRSDLETFLDKLQQQQDPSGALITTRGRRQR